MIVAIIMAIVAALVVIIWYSIDQWFEFQAIVLGILSGLCAFFLGILIVGLVSSATVKGQRAR